MCDTMLREGEVFVPTLDNQQEANFLHRVTNLPLVHSTIGCMSSAYIATKESNSYIQYALDVAEKGVTSVAVTAMPIVDRLGRPIANVDRFACSQLDRLESKVPLLTKPTDTVISTMKSGTMDAVQSGTECWNSSKVGKIVNAGLDKALTTAEGVVDYCLPDNKPVDIEMDDVSPGGDSDDSGSLVVLPVPHENDHSMTERVNAIREKVYHRAYLRMLTNIRTMKQRTDETVTKFNDNMNLMKYAKDNVTWANGAVQDEAMRAQDKLKTAWNTILQMSDGPGTEVDPNETNIKMVERRTLTLARHLVQELKTSTDKLMTMATAYIPESVITQVQTAQHTVVHVYTALTAVSSLHDLPTATLNTLTEQVNSAKLALDTAADYVLASTPFKWMAPNYDIGQLDPYWQEEEIEDELLSTSGSSASPPRNLEDDSEEQ